MMGLFIISGHTAVHSAVRPVSVEAFPDSAYLSIKLPNGVKAIARVNTVAKHSVATSAWAGFFKKAKNASSDMKLAAIPPLPAASIIGTREKTAMTKNRGFLVQTKRSTLHRRRSP